MHFIVQCNILLLKTIQCICHIIQWVACIYIYSPQHIFLALYTFPFFPRTWLMVTGDWQLVTTVCLWCCRAPGHLEYGCLCVCIYITAGLDYGTCPRVAIATVNSCTSAISGVESIPSGCGYVYVCVGRVCNWMCI